MNRSFLRILLILVTQLAFYPILAQTKLELAKNGKTSYTILVDPAAPASVKKAVHDLQHYLGKAATISLQIITDIHDLKINFISVGNTAAKKSAGLTESGLQHDGFKIITKGNHLYIFGTDTPDGAVTSEGGTSHGTANGVYTFLEDYVGVRWLMPGEDGEYIPKVATLTIPILNRTESPLFAFRHLPHIGSGTTVDSWENRLKLGKVAAPQYNHDWDKTIPASLYEQHPTWFASVGGKHLPPVARHKLETTNPALVQAYAEAVMDKFRKNPNQKWHSLSPTDGISGGVDWSDSPAAKALLETAPNGKISRTKLILKFYNDVAKIVRQQFPDHKLGGYIYADYMYPPKDGIPALEPNLAFMLAPSINYGYQLYRPVTQQNFDNLARTWGEASKKYGFELYYYDLPTALMQHNGLIMPPAPDILNYIFPRLQQYGFKGAYVYGRPVWPVFGASNYALAKLKWNPNQDANKILKEYYQKAYGTAAAPHIEKLYSVLDAAYRDYYNRHPEGNYNLTSAHIKEIYAPVYAQLDAQYQKAQATKPTDAGQRKRLSAFGDVLALTQWNLRSLDLLPTNFQSALTINDEQADKIVSKTDNLDWGIATNGLKLPRTLQAKLLSSPGKGNVAGTRTIPLFGAAQLLLQTSANGTVTTQVKAFNGEGEFVRYILTDATGKQIKAGAVREGRPISFNAEADQPYLLDIQTRRGSFELEVTGAAVAYKSNRDNSRGFLINTHQLSSASLPLYFYVPEGSKKLGVNLGFAKDAVVDVYMPSGKKTGRLSTKETPSSRFSLSQNAVEPGLWKLVVHKPEKAGAQTISLLLDESLPQWFILDADQPLQITDLVKSK